MAVNEQEATRITEHVYRRARQMVLTVVDAEPDKGATTIGIIEGLSRVLTILACPHMDRAGFVEVMGQVYDDAARTRDEHVTAQLLRR